MATTEVDLLGEPRLKNGLTYYPGVQTENGSVILGNVVKLQLQAEGSVLYTGYGFLKGLWLWRDQPYIRVQYMAPSSTDLPKDAIAHRMDPAPGAMPELMVTNRVGDLHLNALLGPVFIEGGPLLSQLFQENVGSGSEGFICERHLDPAVQRVQPLDDAFRLTPIVQAFPKTVLRAMLDRVGGSPVRVPMCAAPVPATAPPAPPVTPLSNSESSVAPPIPPAATPSVPTAIVTPVERSALPPRPATPPPPLSATIDVAASPPTSFSPYFSPVLAQTGVRVDSAAAPPEGTTAWNGRPSQGLGPRSARGAILLQAVQAGLPWGRSLTMRCPVDAANLHSRLTSVFGLVTNSLQVRYQAYTAGPWLELPVDGSTAVLLEALELQPELDALPVRVTGEELMHMPPLYWISALISIANLVANAVFAYFELWSSGVEPPFVYLCYLPPLVVLYNAYACRECASVEFLSNQRLRTVLSRKDSTMVRLMAVALFGPDTFTLYCRHALPPLGVTLSMTAEQALVFWGAGLHLLQDVPLLSMNYLMHKRLGREWDAYSLSMIGCSIASLTVNFAWHLFKMMKIKPDDDDPAFATASSIKSPGDTPSPAKRSKSFKKVDASKYVGLASNNLIGVLDA